jgi:hypothetical protein
MVEEGEEDQKFKSLSLITLPFFIGVLTVITEAKLFCAQSNFLVECFFGSLVAISS